MKNCLIMNKLKISIAITFLALVVACNSNERNNSSFAGGENTQSADNQSTENENVLTFKVNGDKISPKISDEKSELKFYTKETILNVDAACEIVSDNENQHISIIIEGLGKGLDELKGSIDIAQTHSVVVIKDGDTQYNFTEGRLEVFEFSKNTGKVKVKIAGKCTIQTGKSYADMKIDIPAELEVYAVFSNIRTFNYTTSKN